MDCLWVISVSSDQELFQTSHHCAKYPFFDRIFLVLKQIEYIFDVVCSIVFVLMERIVGMSIYTTLIYFLTPCSRALLEKLTGFHLVKKFSTFYGT